MQESGAVIVTTTRDLKQGGAYCGTWMARRLDSRWRGEPALSDWMNLAKLTNLFFAGEEVLISYGDFSNPLLFRTYGFTLPSRPGSQESQESQDMPIKKTKDLKNEDVCPRFVPDFLAFSMVFPDVHGIFRRFSQQPLCVVAFSKVRNLPELYLH